MITTDGDRNKDGYEGREMKMEMEMEMMMEMEDGDNYYHCNYKSFIGYHHFHNHYHEQLTHI